MSFFNRMRQTIEPRAQQITEMIGRWSSRVTAMYPNRVVVDHTITDYEFWDALRRGKQLGYELGGLFARPITQIIASWTLGDGFTVNTDDDYTNTVLSGFVQEHLETFVQVCEDHLALGDAYIVVNADATIQTISPSQVQIETDPDNPRQYAKVTITSHDTLSGVQTEDVYTSDERTITRRYKNQVTVETYPNIFSEIPIVGFHNDRSANEVYGHPIYEELLTLMAEYDDVLRKSLDGVKIMGNPIPVAEGLEDPETAKRVNATYTDTYVDELGNTQTEYVTEFDRVSMLYFGKGGSFKFASPAAFTSNATDVLHELFQMMLRNSQVPEWVWGGAIASSMASVDAQTPAFVKFIQGRRRKLERPTKKVLMLYLLALSLIDRRVQAPEAVAMQWPDLTPGDDAVRLQWVQYMDSRGYLQPQTVVQQSQLVDDPGAEVDAARAYYDDTLAAQEEAVARMIMSSQPDDAELENAA